MSLEISIENGLKIMPYEAKSLLQSSTEEIEVEQKYLPTPTSLQEDAL